MRADRRFLPTRTDGRASPWPWRTGAPAGSTLPAGLLDEPAESLARRLLGQRIVSDIDGERTSGVIVETEAYVGPHDPASHAAARIGRTARNDVMFGRPGRAYVYFIYGMHWCLNVVAAAEGYPSGVLIRALDPLVGEDVMLARRGRRPLASGPARLCQALGVDGRFNGHDLSGSPLRLEPGWRVEPGRIASSGRIGVRRAGDWPLRFFLEGHAAVSA